MMFPGNLCSLIFEGSWEDLWSPNLFFVQWKNLFSKIHACNYFWQMMDWDRYWGRRFSLELWRTGGEWKCAPLDNSTPQSSWNWWHLPVFIQHLRNHSGFSGTQVKGLLRWMLFYVADVGSIFLSSVIHS
jgi:hypothetical protein